ncbi:MAG: endopeptidase La [Nitrospirae bacterium]|nr:MAG: endopeptidase La [Nitrospirota bacterium]
MSDAPAIPADEEPPYELPETLPLLPVRDVVVFPYMVLPLFVGRERSLAAVEEAMAGDRMIMLATQRDFSVEDPSPEEIYAVGTAAMIMRRLRLPDGRQKLLVQGLEKARIRSYVAEEPCYEVAIEPLPDPEEVEATMELEASMRTVKEQLSKVIALGKAIIPDILVMAENIDAPGRLADLIASNLNLKIEQAQGILEETDVVRRLTRVSEILATEIELLSMQQKIQDEAKGEMDKVQREYFLREQLKAIQRELGETGEMADEIAQLRERILKAKMPPKVEEEALKQLGRLARLHEDAAEAGILRAYLELMAELPWRKRSKDNLDLAKAAAILDEDHYGLKEVKERILEYLAVRKLKGKKMKGPILCFVGPPGVGKTSLGRSIARAMGRKFYRISLGGMRDEAEIRGHRRTYVGALPGRVIHGIHQCGTNNPVFMMDEVDKIGADFRGDPASALLEVLDPEQNSAFVDHYLAVPFDLSNVMFITTANWMDPIPAPLRDRMEIIELTGYTLEEKVAIARRYLLPRQMEENGIDERHLALSDRTLERIIGQYTRESGLRKLEQRIGRICRKVARRVAEGRTGCVRVTPASLPRYLGVPPYDEEITLTEDQVGVATGLAWTPVGGELLFIEATKVKGKGGLILTGQLGEVMKESAQAALTFVKSRARELGITAKQFADHDIHIHFPAGAIPKDGPSAGIAVAVAIASVFTGRPIRHRIAMTGEISLRGRVLPIGGLKEKALAALRAGIPEVIVPKANAKELDRMPRAVKRGIRFLPVERADEVLERCLVAAPRRRTSGRRRAPAARRRVATA